MALDRYQGDAFDALYSAEESRALDRLAIERYGIPGIVLMKRAGEAAWRALRRRWPDARAITVVCGRGNNAGDGYIVAGCAASNGVATHVIQLGPASALRGDAARARDWALGFAPDVSEVDADGPAFDVAGDVVVDALLGTGTQGDVRPGFAIAFDLIRRAGRPVLALDVPSGVCADTGRVLGSAVRADATITFISMKRGLTTGSAPDLTGPVELATLGVPADVYRTIPGIAALRWDAARSALPQRAATAYKHQSGHVLIVGGDSGMGGAAAMAGEAALRVGAGLVSVATRHEHVAPLLARRPELMVKGVDEPAQIEALLGRATIVAIGPGLGRGEWGRALFAKVLASGKPLVIDADALHLLADGAVIAAPAVVTPHVAEAATLLNCSAADVQRDRFAAAAALVERYGRNAPLAAIVKGAGSVVASRTLPLGVCLHGNAGMASAGMGDVLSGVVAGLAAQGLDPTQAATAGACLHSLAGDRAAERDGARGLIATDLLAELRAILNDRSH